MLLRLWSPKNGSLLLFPLIAVAVFVLIFVEVRKWGFQSAEAVEGARKVEYLLDTLENSSDYKVRIAAATQLGKVANGTLADWMVRAFRKEDELAVRLAIIYAIGNIPDHRIFPPLIELVHQEILQSQELLAIERVLWNQRKAVNMRDWEQEAVSSKDRSIRGMAAWLLGITGGQSVLPTLAQLTKDKSPYVRLRAVQGIGKIGSPKGMPYCNSAAKSDPDRSVKKAAKSCQTFLELKQKGKIPQDKNHQVDLKLDLYGLAQKSVTAHDYLAYRTKNVNPRIVHRVAGKLQENQAEVRVDKTIRFVYEDPNLKTINVDGEMITNYAFRTVDVKGLGNIIPRKIGEINYCYVKVLEKSKRFGGDIIFTWKVVKSGKVVDLKRSGGNLNHSQVQNCISKEIQSTRFPEIPIDFVQMTYKFGFVPPADEKYRFKEKDVAGQRRGPRP